MINDDGNKIEIYSNTDITDLKIRLIVFVLAAISGIYMFITAHAYNLIFLGICALMLLGIFITFKEIKKTKAQKLEAEITENNIKFYTKKKIVEYEFNKIKNLSCDSIYSNTNEIFVNYYDDNNKLKTDVFLITGCDKNRFVDIANSVKGEAINKNSNIEKKEVYDNNEKTDNFYKDNIENDTQKEREPYEILKSGENLKVLFLGKNKLLKKYGNEKYSLPQSSIFYFIDSNGNELNFYLQQLDIDDKDLKVNDVYTIKYNKKYKYFIVELSNQDFNTEIIENIKNKVEYRNTLLFDDEMIQLEIKYEDIVNKLRTIMRYVIFLDLVVLLKNPEIGFTIFFAAILISLFILTYIRNKCKKLYESKS